METEKSWEKFILSGRVDDYLNFANSRREKEISEGNRDSFYNGSFSDKGNESRGE